MCEDIAETVMKECGSDIQDPGKLLDQIESRLDLIRTLKRKYGNTVEEIIDFKNKAETELNELETADDRIIDLKHNLEQITKEMSALCSIITQKRKTAGKALEKKMTEELVFLEMNKVSFSVDISKSDVYRPDGIDIVRFLISANAGEPLAPLAKIASGGELSRTMLALKSALADKEKTPTLIFDEVDTGISGKTSYKIGVKLKSCSKTAQVICVTHSPQIASQADLHLLVSKHEKNGRTLTSVQELDIEGRTKEIARIIGGETVTDKTIKAAEEMIRG
jgi:DNA repair protein RecN (Recombination protein N)